MFSGETKLLTATVQGAGKDAEAEGVKALAADGRRWPKIRLLAQQRSSRGAGQIGGRRPLPTNEPVEVEAVWDAPAPDDAVVPPAKTFAGEKKLADVVLEPFSLTLVIVPADGGQERRGREFRSVNEPNYAAAEESR